MATIDWTEYDRLVNLFRTGSPNIAAAFDENKRIVNLVNGGTPPGTLRWKPPGYPAYAGYNRITATGGAQRLDLNNNSDYLVTLGSKQWSSLASGRSIGLHINGGRNVVVIGGALLFNGTNPSDDAVAVMVDGGTDAGIVHLEGLNIDCANGITVRSKRIVQIENCRVRVRAFQDQYANIHPDMVQIWGTGIQPAAIRMHKFTGFTRYSGLSCLESDPLVWERYEVDLHPDTNVNGSKDASNYAYMTNGATGQAGGPYCEYKGEVYAELPTGGGGAYLRKIDDLCCARSVSPLLVFPYEIKSPAGAVLYTSPANPTGGNSPNAAGTGTGNYLTYDRVPKFVGHKWIIGKPPGGEFVPATVPGPSYVSPGYL
jgi:hypothetical protein